MTHKAKLKGIRGAGSAMLDRFAANRNNIEHAASWRVIPVAFVARLFGVLIKIEGLPFGSSARYLRNRGTRQMCSFGTVGGATSTAVE